METRLDVKFREFTMVLMGSLDTFMPALSSLTILMVRLALPAALMITSVTSPALARSCRILLEDVQTSETSAENDTIDTRDLLEALVLESKLFSSKLFSNTIKEVVRHIPKDDRKFKYADRKNQDRYVKEVYDNLRAQFPTGQMELRAFSKENPTALVGLNSTYGADKMSHQEAAEFHDIFEMLEKRDAYKKLILEYIRFSLIEEDRIEKAKDRRQIVEDILTRQKMIINADFSVSRVEDLEAGKIRISRINAQNQTVVEEGSAEDFILFEYPLLFTNDFFKIMSSTTFSGKDKKFVENLKNSETFVRQDFSERIWSDVLDQQKKSVRRYDDDKDAKDLAFESALRALEQSKNVATAAKTLIYNQLDQIAETTLKFKKIQSTIQNRRLKGWKILDESSSKQFLGETHVSRLHQGVLRTVGTGVGIEVGYRLFASLWHSPDAVPPMFVIPILAGWAGGAGAGKAAAIASDYAVGKPLKALQDKVRPWRTSRMAGRLAKMTDKIKSNAVKNLSNNNSQTEE